MSTWKNKQFEKDLTEWSNDPRLRRKARRRKVVLIGIIAVLVLAAVLSVKPAYRAYRNYRTDENFRAAQAAAASGDWLTARDRARSVLLVRRGDMPTVRIWFKAMKELKDPYAIDGAFAMFLNQQSQIKDKYQALDFMADEAPQAVFLVAMNCLKENERKHPEAVAPLMRFFTRRSQPLFAVGLYREAGGEQHRDAAMDLEKIRALCAALTPERLTECRRIFLGLRDEAGPAPLQALRLLGWAQGGLDLGPDFPDLTDWINSRPDAEPLDHLYVLQQQLVARPENQKALIDQAIKDYRGKAPVALGGWLLRFRFANEAAEILAEPAKTDADAFLTRVNCLMNTGRTAEARDLLGAPPTGMDKIKLQTAKAAVEMSAKNHQAAVVAMRAALDQAHLDNLNNRFLEIHRYAASLGLRDVADEAMVNAIRLGRGPIPLHDDIQPMLAQLAQEGRTEDILGLSRVMTFYEPTNPALRNNFLYLACLHRVMPAKECVANLVELAADRPDLPEIQASLAFACLMADQPKEAREALAKAGDSPRIPKDFRLAMEGTAAALLGDEGAARATLGKTNWKNMLAREADTFRELLASAKVANLPLPEIGRKKDYEVKPLGEWQESMKPKMRDLPPDKPVEPNYPVLDLEKWRELQKLKGKREEGK